MTEHNHRRGTRRTLPDLGPKRRMTHGWLPNPHAKAWRYPFKGCSGWFSRGKLSDVSIGAGTPNDFTDGHRGMARAVKGAKKYINSRFRFHENQASRRLASSPDPED